MVQRAGVDGLSRHHLELVPSWGRRLAGIEGLRGLAALSVVVFHTIHVLTPAEQHGIWGVAGYLNEGLTLFFVLSGFLLFRPFGSSVIRGSVGPRLGSYFANRALRIWPAYVVVFVLVNFGFQAARLPGPATPTQVQVGVLPLGETVLNLLLLQNVTPAIRTGLEVAWTLGAELCFYLVLPLLYQACKAVSRVRGVSGLAAAFVAPGILLVVGATTRLSLAAATRGMSPADAYAAVWGNNASSIVARSLLGQADLFALGMLAAIAYTWMQDARLTGQWLGRIRIAMWILALASLLGVTRVAPFADQLAAVASACLLLLAVAPDSRGRDAAVGRVLDLAPLRFVGLVSYSLYLWHLAIIRWLALHHLTGGPGFAGSVLNLVEVLAVSLVLSSITYYAVEKQALRLKKPSGTPPAVHEAPLPAPGALTTTP